MRSRIVLLFAALLVSTGQPAARAEGTIGTTFPSGFPVIIDHSLGVPVIGFGSDAGQMTHTPVIFLHGNNDTPYPTLCNEGFGKIRNFAQYFLDHGYSPNELWGLGYQGEQCDILTDPSQKSAAGHSTLANVPDLRSFVHAVLAYTGASQVDIIGHSLGTTLAREWMRQDDAYGLVRRLVGVDGPNHGIINCSPNVANIWQVYALGEFTPNSAICVEYGSNHTAFLDTLNAGGETPGPTAYLTITNADRSFVYFSNQDGLVPPVPPEDRTGAPHDFSASARLDGAPNVGLFEQGQYDSALLASHLGIVNSPEAFEHALSFLS
jgi:pimeloyl-ACP methyl ester carboxylesterase